MTYQLPEPAGIVMSDNGYRSVRWSVQARILTTIYTADQMRQAYAAGREARPVCLWNNADGCWETTCGNAFEINDGTPAENNMTYCCYCGGLKRRVRAALEEPR